MQCYEQESVRGRCSNFCQENRNAGEPGLVHVGVNGKGKGNEMMVAEEVELRRLDNNCGIMRFFQLCWNTVGSQG